MPKPVHITLTGVDRKTDLHRLVDLSARYQVEWGVLFSKNRQGVGNRYPDDETISAILDLPESVMLAAHVCGKYAQDIMTGEYDLSTLPLSKFTRVQVNHTHPDQHVLASLSAIIDRPVIAQSREPDVFAPRVTTETGASIYWLYDASGGRGISPHGWPVNLSDGLVGYAGGLRPENCAQVNETVGPLSPSGYWLDMETGVRTDDWFDLDKCEAVLSAVYG